MWTKLLKFSFFNFLKNKCRGFCRFCLHVLSFTVSCCVCGVKVNLLKPAFVKLFTSIWISFESMPHNYPITSLSMFVACHRVFFCSRIKNVDSLLLLTYSGWHTREIPIFLLRGWCWAWTCQEGLIFIVLVEVCFSQNPYQYLDKN